MATRIITEKNIISFDGSNDSGYELTADYTTSRVNNSTVKFTFTLTLKGVASSTFTAYGLRVSVKVGNSSTVNVDFVANGTTARQGPYTKTATLNVSSSSAQTLTATFKGVKQAGYGTYRTLTASVKTPAASGGGGGGSTTTTKCSPPTALTSTGVASKGDYIAIDICCSYRIIHIAYAVSVDKPQKLCSGSGHHLSAINPYYYLFHALMIAEDRG